MPRKKVDDDDPETASQYSLPFPRSSRWGPNYFNPRNSLDPDYTGPAPKASTDPRDQPKQPHDTKGEEDEPHNLANLSHWLETLAEFYMNNLDNRARWDPRWLNVTQRERQPGLKSASVTILDYQDEGGEPLQTKPSTKKELAESLQSRADMVDCRVLVVTDVSRFLMGALGQAFSIDPEFWFEHLANSGYAWSDIGLKVNNALWMNWAEQEFRFRHRPLPGTGQRTEWNTTRRTKGRCWTHLRWGRLGLLHYLGKKGFYEAEIERRLDDGRWMIERDVLLDKRGLLMTEQRLLRAKKTVKAKEKEKQANNKKKEQHGPNPTPGKKLGNTAEELNAHLRVKTSNIYRAYSTFESLPKNVTSWDNRDLRVVSPEAVSYWSGKDANGRNTVVVVLDPSRNMKDKSTNETIPSLTFMPRPMEIESYTQEELWRTAEPEETYLDPPPPPFSKSALKQEKREAKRLQQQRLKEKMARKASEEKAKVQAITSEILHKKDPTSHNDSFDTMSTQERAHTAPGGIQLNNDDHDHDDEEDDDDLASVSAYSSDDEYDDEYEKEIRVDYSMNKQQRRDRDFARKYSLTTHDLVCRHLSRMTAAELRDDDGACISFMLSRMILDDFWQLLAELRLELDHVDNDFSGSLYDQLVDAIGNTKRQDLTWIRTITQEMHDWLVHATRSASTSIMRSSDELKEEFGELKNNLEAVQVRAEQSLNILATSMALAQSALVIEQTSGINKVTELAFFFVPVSFVTAVFSMQVLEFENKAPRLWHWGLTLALAVLLVYIVRTILRSPSVRIGIIHCQATIVARFSSTKSGSTSRRLNSVSNRAVAKFMFFLISFLTVLMIAFLFYVLLWLLIFGLLWMGLIATAVYFIVTKWPELSAVIPAFISIPISLAMWYASYWWFDEIDDWLQASVMSSMIYFKGLYPEKWLLDKVVDEDLAKEGVNTYARQALLLVT